MAFLHDQRFHSRLALKVLKLRYLQYYLTNLQGIAHYLGVYPDDPEAMNQFFQQSSALDLSRFFSSPLIRKEANVSNLTFFFGL